MKGSTRVKKILKQMEVSDHDAWLAAHNDAFRFINILLAEERDRVTKEMDKEEDYDSPNWTLLKADQSGQRRLTNKLLTIFKD